MKDDKMNDDMIKQLNYFSYHLSSFHLSSHLIVTICVLTRELARAAFGFGGLADAYFRRLFIMPAHLHLAEKAFALHLFLQHAERLVDVIITDNDFYQKNVPPSRDWLLSS